MERDLTPWDRSVKDLERAMNSHKLHSPYAANQAEKFFQEIMSKRASWSYKYQLKVRLVPCDTKDCQSGGQLLSIPCPNKHRVCVTCFSKCIVRETEFTYRVKCTVCGDEELYDSPVLSDHLPYSLANKIEQQLLDPKIEEKLNMPHYKVKYLDETMTNWRKQPHVEIICSGDENVEVKLKGGKNTVLYLKAEISGHLSEQYKIFHIPCSVHHFNTIDHNFRETVKMEHLCDLKPINMEGADDDIIVEGAENLESYMEYYGPIENVGFVRDIINNKIQETIRSKVFSLTDSILQNLQVEEVEGLLIGPDCSLKREKTSLTLLSSREDFEENVAVVMEAIKEAGGEDDEERGESDASEDLE